MLREATTSKYNLGDKFCKEERSDTKTRPHLIVQKINDNTEQTFEKDLFQKLETAHEHFRAAADSANKQRQSSARRNETTDESRT